MTFLFFRGGCGIKKAYSEDEGECFSKTSATATTVQDVITLNTAM
jgi:hypothetical protein